jgi:hypothetical protein
MNQQLSALLEKLAAKLGTTTEYLWGILIKQAHISATMSLLCLAISIVGGIILFKLHKTFLIYKKDGNYERNKYETDEALPAIMGGFAVIWLMFTIYVICTLPNIFNGYFNPEYWALKEILDSI